MRPDQLSEYHSQLCYIVQKQSLHLYFWFNLFPEKLNFILKFQIGFLYSEVSEQADLIAKGDCFDLAEKWVLTLIYCIVLCQKK